VFYTTKEGWVAKFKYIQWLMTFLEAYDFFVFEWDAGNSNKSEDKHGVNLEQIESCFIDEKIMPLGIQFEPEVKEDRYGIIAKDCEGTILFVCFTIRDGKIRPVSGRLANKKEREMYEA